MKRRTKVGGLALLGLSLAAASCSSSDGYPSETNTVGQGESMEQGGAAIDVAQDSRVSLGLRGGLGPIVQGQTVTKAMVSMQDVWLVTDSGAAFPLVKGAFTADLLALQNSLQSLVQDQLTQAGHFTSLRFRLESAWIQTVDDQSVAHVFASANVDPSQFASVGSVGALQLGGIDANGFCTVALPAGGIQVQGTASLALHFSLAESLSFENDTWLFQPRVWCVDAGAFSSLDVQFEATESFSESFTEGFQVMLFDANLRPVCAAPLAFVSSTVFVASFQLVESFEGPFVAILVPPAGIALQSTVAVSVDVRERVHAQTSIRVSSVQQVSTSERVRTLDVRTDAEASFTERASSGQVITHRTRPVGSIDTVAPHTRPKEPVRPGEEAPGEAQPPQIPGLPAPKGMPSKGMPPTGKGAPQPGPGEVGPGKQPTGPSGKPSPADAGAPSLPTPGKPSMQPGPKGPALDAGAPPATKGRGPKGPSLGGRGPSFPEPSQPTAPPPTIGPSPHAPAHDAGAPPSTIGPRPKGPSLGGGGPSTPQPGSLPRPGKQAPGTGGGTPRAPSTGGGERGPDAGAPAPVGGRSRGGKKSPSD